MPSQFTIGGAGDFPVTNDLLVAVLPRRLFICIGRIRKIFWRADQERQPLRGPRVTNVSAKLVPIALPLFHTDQDQVVQGSPPP